MDIKALISKIPIDFIIGRDFRLKQSGIRYKRGIEHDSLVVDLQTNRFYWNSAGLAGSALDWLTKVKGLSYRDALTLLQEYSGLPLTNVFEVVEAPTPLYPKLLQTFHTLGREYRDYWYRRGYTDATIDKFKLGYTGRAFVIPVMNGETLMNFQCRIGHGAEKRIWMWASNRPPYPFNVDGHKDNYTLMAEGLTDAISLWQLGFPVISQSAGNMTWRKDWNQYIINFNFIYLLYDNDDAGINGSYRVGRKLLNRAYILYWPDWFEDKYDVNKLVLQYGEDLARSFISGVLLPNAVHISAIAQTQGRNVAFRDYDIVKRTRKEVGMQAREFLKRR